MQALSDHPGLLFVAATFLPLAAFTLLLVLGGVRNFLRPFHHQPAWAGVYRFLDHDATGRGSFYVGFAGIVLAFFCSFSGFCLYLGEWHHHAEAEQKTKEAIAKLEKSREEPGADVKAIRTEIRKLEK